MTDRREFKLPDVGEGLTEADIVTWRVKPGDPVTVNQTIVDIETAKAVVELPSPWDGVVAELLVDEGQTVDVGTPIIAVDTAAAGSPAPAPAAAGPAPAAPATGDSGTSAPSGGERQPVLVGYGVKSGSSKRRPRKTTPMVPAPAATAASGTPTAPAPATATPVKYGPTAPTVRVKNGGGRALAKPPVRKLARDLGVDLSQLSGSGPAGSITRDDIQRAADHPDAFSPSNEKVTTDSGTTAAGLATAGATEVAGAREADGDGGISRTHEASGAGVAGGTRVAGGTLEAGGAREVGGAREERIPVRGVRRATAQAVAGSAFTAPHVTEFLEVDVTGTMAAVAQVRTLPEFDGVRVSPLLFVAQALLVAARRHPMINSSWDEQAQEIVVKHYVNLGFAAATDRGLLVPNIKDAQALSLPALARAFADLTATARAGRCSPAELTGGTMTITNVGVFGVDAGTPILTPGEAAILAFGRIREAPWVHDGQLAVRQVTTLSLSFDHRIVDGELGSAVLRDVGQMLEDPVRMLAWA
ncbi:MAG: 2-oxo acid dehydrogenase subunit E2 [Actinobacteria bacterium]|nr:2-oxo acid dehydrogenase subunit E2 [Actinomycetota bacterium]